MSIDDYEVPNFDGPEGLRIGLSLIRDLVDSKGDEFPLSLMKDLPSVVSLTNPGVEAVQKASEEGGLDTEDIKILFATTSQAMMESVLVRFVQQLDELGLSERIFDRDPTTREEPKPGVVKAISKIALMSDLDIHHEVENFLKDL